MLKQLSRAESPALPMACLTPDLLTGTETRGRQASRVRYCFSARKSLIKTRLRALAPERPREQPGGRRGLWVVPVRGAAPRWR